jgi:hypothetical protein
MSGLEIRPQLGIARSSNFKSKWTLVPLSSNAALDLKFARRRHQPEANFKSAALAWRMIERMVGQFTRRA